MNLVIYCNLYLIDAAVAILVYDITRKTSFEEINNYWINQLRENAKKNIRIYIILLLILVIAVAANKSDMYEYEEIDEKAGKKFAKVEILFKLNRKLEQYLNIQVLRSHMV